MKHYIGIDLGGTNTKIGVVDSEGNLINSKIIKTHSHQNVNKTLERIWETAKKLILEKEIPLFSVVGIGIGIPGPVKNQSTVGFFANFDWERNLNLKEKMEYMIEKLQKIKHLEIMHVPQGGFFIWIKLANYINSEKFYYKCRLRGLSILPGFVFYSNSEEVSSKIRISTVSSTIEEVERGLDIIQDVLNNCDFSEINLK